MKKISAVTTISSAVLFLFPCLVGFSAEAPGAPAKTKSDSTPTPEPRTISFSWRPKMGPAAAYRLEETEDQHRIIIFPGAEHKGAPVLLGFHGQPMRGKNPRDYLFASEVISVVREMIAAKEIPPVILVLPVFRFVGQNWPGFDIEAFKGRVNTIFQEQELTPGGWYLFGHSGAAGCGGDGLNQAHRIAPKAVGFFDTCLGIGWQEEAKALYAAKIRTVHLHSVETAGFRPKQRPEYQTTFDFGRAWGPLGIRPVDCPKVLPGAPLRKQPYRCAATANGIIEGYVVDTGEGVEAHKKLLPVALRYFLRRFVSR